MRGFASLIEGLEKIRNTLQEPFKDPIADSASVLKQLSGVAACASEFFVELRDQGLLAIQKKEDITGELLVSFDELFGKVTDPDRPTQVRALELEGNAVIHPIQKDLRSLFTNFIQTISGRMDSYRSPTAASAPRVRKSVTFGLGDTSIPGKAVSSTVTKPVTAPMTVEYPQAKHTQAPVVVETPKDEKPYGKKKKEE